MAKNVKDTGRIKDEPMVMEEVFIRPQQDEKLDQLADEVGVSKSEIIRRAIDDYVSRKGE